MTKVQQVYGGSLYELAKEEYIDRVNIVEE